MKKSISINFYLGSQIYLKWPNEARFLGATCFPVPSTMTTSEMSLGITLSFAIDEKKADVWRVLTCLYDGEELPAAAKHLVSLFTEPGAQIHVYELTNATVPDDIIEQIEHDMSRHALTKAGIMLPASGIVR